MIFETRQPLAARVERHNVTSRGVSLLVALLLLFLFAGCQPAHEFAGTEYPEPEVAPDFELESAAGPVKLSDFDGRFVMLYFGYTFCPDVCPATLANMKQVRRLLEEDADQLQVIMITVDPDRDTADQLAEYVGYFDDSFIGLTGDQAAIDGIAKTYGVYHQKHEGTEATGYLVDHTAATFLLDSQRRLRLIFSYDDMAEQIADDIRFLIKKEG
jgi:protein SCO1/2